jgi:hypothetical protein
MIYPLYLPPYFCFFFPACLMIFRAVSAASSPFAASFASTSVAVGWVEE